MTNRELRGYDTAIQDIKDFEDKKYILQMFFMIKNINYNIRYF